MRTIDADGLAREICRDQCEKDGCGSHCELIAYVENAPTVEGGSWIGADKRPEKPGKYLVYGVTFFVPDHNGEPCGHWEIKIADWSDKWGWDCKVKCWRPLPEPPEEGYNAAD